MAVRIPSLRFSGVQKQLTPIQEEANVLGAAGQVVGQLGQIKQQQEQREASAWSVKADSDLRLASMNALDEAQREAEQPQQIGELFFKKIEEQKNSLSETAPNDLARSKFNNIYENVKQSYGQQAIRAEANESAALRDQEITSAIDNNITQIRNGADYNEVSSINNNYLEEAKDNYGLSEFRAKKEASKRGLKLARLDYLFEQGELEEVSSLISDTKFNKELDSKDVTAYRDAINKQKLEIKALQTTDPAKYSILNGARDVDEIVEYQVKAGVPPEQASVMPKERAQEIVADLKNISSSQEFVNAIATLKQDYKIYTPNAINDLVNQKLPSVYLYASQLDPNNNRDAEALDLLYGVSKSGSKEVRNLTKSLMEQENKIYKDFSNELTNEMEDHFLNFLNEGKSPEVINGIFQDTLDLASARYNRTKDYKGSIDFAIDVVQGDFNNIDYNENIIKVPNIYDTELVETGLDQIIKEDSISITGIRDPEMAEEISKNLKERSKFVLNAKRDGVLLVSEFGEPFLSKEGNLIEYTFDEVVKRGKKAPKMRTDEEKIDDLLQFGFGL